MLDPIEHILIGEGIVKTLSGRTVNLLDPQPQDIHWPDILTGLSNICRYAGQTPTFFSVAQHLVHGYMIAPKKLRRAWLLHDAAEAYTSDIPKPLKVALPAFAEIEERLERVIYEKAGEPYENLELIRNVDDAMYWTERRDLFGWTVNGKASWHAIRYPMLPHEARNQLETFYKREGIIE